MAHSPDFGDLLATHVDGFTQAIDDCLELYRSSAEIANKNLPATASAYQRQATQELMDDLARGLLVKIFLTIVQADRHFSAPEKQLAQVLLHKLWGRMIASEEIGLVLAELIPMADSFDWHRLVKPFEQYPALRERVSELETIAMRFGNLVAKADGTVTAEESLQLKGLLAEIDRHLRPMPFANDDATLADSPDCDQIRRGLDALPTVSDAAGTTPSPAAKPSQSPAPTDEKRLQAALAALDELIGLEGIKNEVRELTRFLRVQQQREQAGLPRTQVSLHTVFTGNPGTGKTSVARVLGEVLGALGIVRQGHLIEADRSSLVAGYVGQTAERTNKIIDRALDGVLFIDEAYSLVSGQSDDPYGQEALQILLKRMEDDRDRLVVVLAGYPREMERLLAANTGLASRFQRTLRFPDYSVVELCRIFQLLCDKNHYVIPAETRARLILGFAYVLQTRNEQFGNGRLVRNVFEQAIRRLANRVADMAPLTKELLTRLEPADVLLNDVPESAIGADATHQLSIHLICPGCGHASKLRATFLTRRVQCNKCQRQFTAEWGEPIPASAARDA